MNKRMRRIVLPVACAAIVFTSCSIHTASKKENNVVGKAENEAAYELTEVIYTVQTEPPPISNMVENGKTTSLSQEDIELIALVTMAEAEGECEEGKRLVIDTILNRIDSDKFPNTAYDVVYQKYHFSSMWNGRVDRCEVREDICNLVKEELENRTNDEVMFFTAGRYSDYGVPMFQVENHYFSRYE